MTKHILIADDDVAIVEVVSLVLEDDGYRISSTSDGQTVLKLDKSNLPDLILLDIWMSGIDGRDIVKHLKKQVHTQAIPVILFSANRDCEAIALECGAEDYLLKPFDIDDLLAKIKKNL
jgi:DNA-binding response OmpR family regulator